MNKEHPYNIDSDEQDEQWLHQTPPKKNESGKIDKAKKILGIK